MPRILMLETALVNYGDERGGVPEAAGALVNVPPDQAKTLVSFGRALYTRRGDDPTKGLNTAPQEIVDAAESAAKAAAGAQTPAE